MKTAYVIGSGPNGLTAAITLARAGIRTTVLEAQSTIGGGARTLPLTLPGFMHDICSAVHPMAVSSPALRALPLAEHGLQWIQPDAPLAHPLDGGSAAVMEKSIESTAAALGEDGAAWRAAFGPLAKQWDELSAEILDPVHFPRHPMLMARFGLMALRSARGLAKSLFRTEAARALFAGSAAHAVMPFQEPASAAIGLTLTCAGHSVGWPIARGGSQSITNALSSYFQSIGGAVLANARVGSLGELPGDALVLCDISPRELLKIAGSALPHWFSRKLERFRYGPGAFKVDWALDRPIPWTAPECRRAGTLHVGGTLSEIANAERAPWEGRVPARPFVLLSQPSVFDSSRAPAGKHTGWAYCHVPNGSTEDMTEAIESQVERFAPGFRSTILARNTINAAQMEHHNANLIGGDVNGGAQDLPQMFLRPTARLYGTPLRGVYLCSASTPPGGGVHGMCGYNAARLALRFNAAA